MTARYILAKFSVRKGVGRGYAYTRRARFIKVNSLTTNEMEWALKYTQMETCT